MDIIKTLEQLSALRGVSGDEGRVRDAIAERLAGVCELQTDSLGNLLAFKKGAATPKKKLMLSAHMDEVGFIITRIEDSGLLRFTTCGGIDSRVIVGKAVEVGDNALCGVIGLKATHQTKPDELDKPVKVDELYIDIGAESREQAETLVSPGDRAVFYAPFRKLGKSKLMGRAFDDRAGCALLVHLAETELPYDCHFAFTVQEETGCAGAAAAGYTVAPDIAVAVEATTASDIAGVSPDKVVCKLGGGPVISFMDRGTVYDSGLFRLALDTAEKNGIPAQVKEGVFGGNESRELQTAAGGSRVMAVSLPCRYIHSPSNVLDERDVSNALRLLEALAGELGGLE